MSLQTAPYSHQRFRVPTTRLRPSVTELCPLEVKTGPRQPRLPRSPLGGCGPAQLRGGWGPVHRRRTVPALTRVHRWLAGALTAHGEAEPSTGWGPGGEQAGPGTGGRPLPTQLPGGLVDSLQRTPPGVVDGQAPAQLRGGAGPRHPSPYRRTLSPS